MRRIDGNTVNRGVHVGTGTKRSNGLLQRSSFSYVLIPVAVFWWLAAERSASANTHTGEGRPSASPEIEWEEPSDSSKGKITEELPTNTTGSKKYVKKENLAMNQSLVPYSVIVSP